MTAPNRDIDGTALAAEAAEPRRGLLREYWDFLNENKKWWLVPILVTIGLMGALALLSGSAAGPFVYTLF